MANMTEAEFQKFLAFCTELEYTLPEWQERLMHDALTTDNPRPVFIQYKSSVRSMQMQILMRLYREFIIQSEQRKDI